MMRIPEPALPVDERKREMRRVIYAHLSDGATDMTLTRALDQLIERFNGCDGCSTCRMIQIGSSQQLSFAKQFILMRLVQEGLLNIQQHARAHSSVLTLHYETLMVTLTLQDDGVGLLDGTHERPGVHALRAMQYCLTEFDGNLEVFEAEQGGVVVRATLPLDE
ncbi:MAG: hypothetical protein HC837_11500 [Chloroflexaceae bacterium]|nr:hypothetical protein [Chloroflexaceae bacterium]